MPEIGEEQTVTGDFAVEMQNPPYAFQEEEPSSASISISDDKIAESAPLQLVQAK